MGLKVGICGAGMFARSFVPLFQAHPSVDAVCLAEVLPDRRRAEAARFGIAETYASLDELCASDVDAVALFTQRWLHGPQAIQALRSGKHVYSAVPAAISVEEMAELVETVRATGLVYMVGETSYYYPSTLYCRRRFAAGEFGRFVYGEGEYLHDMSHGFYDAYRHSGGVNWKAEASFPPMLYPTHSIAMVLSITGARMTHVSCFGFLDEHEDGIFRAEVSRWGNRFSNESALFRTSDGGACRINEFRRVGLVDVPPIPEVRLSLYGTEACYEEQANARAWVTKDPPALLDLRAMLKCTGMSDAAPERAGIPDALAAGFFSGVSAVHPVERLPPEFAGLPNGHQGSHQFLVLDFLEACAGDGLPPNHVWAAARYCVPGIVAHESARRDGELLPIPDFGDPSP